MRTLASFAAAIWLLFGGSAIAAPPYLLGFWFGTGQPGSKDDMWLEQFSANGDFRGFYRSCAKGKARDTFLIGRWSLAGDRETIDILTQNGEAFSRTDLYQFVSFDGRIWKYRFLLLGYVYTARRVDEKFKMLGCEAVS